MRKSLHIILGILGTGLVGYSVTQGWGSVEMAFTGGTLSIPGYDFWQGIVSAIAAVAGLALIFFKPKLAIVPALVVIACAALFYFNVPDYMKEPMLEPVPCLPGKMVFGAMVGGALLALGGLVAKKS